MPKARSKSTRPPPAQRTTAPRSYHPLLVLVLACVAAILALYLSSRLLISPTPADAPTALPAPPAAATMEPALAPTVAPTATATLTPTPAITATPTLSATVGLPITATQPINGAPPVYTYEVVQVYPHDPTAFTQGLLFDQGNLYEGTGLNGRSSLRKVELTTGEVLQQIDLAQEYFGEGITIFGDQLYQLTWQSQVGFIYDKTTFTQQQEFTYPTEGWGITQDGTRLIMSDGTPRLYFRDPATLAEIGTVDVYDHTGPIAQLNELEYIQSEVYANIWQTDRIARIDPTSGQVVGWIDLTGLLPAAERSESGSVLNGIAYLADEDRLFVTGKLWPKLFEIKLLPKP